MATPHARRVRFLVLLAGLSGLLGLIALNWFWHPRAEAPLEPSYLAPLDLPNLPTDQPQVQARAHASWEDPLLTRQRQVWPMVRRLSREAGLDPALIMAVVQVESAFDPQATSGRGAKGLMQLNRHTLRHLGLSETPDAETNLEAGIRYLAELKRTFSDDMTLALAAYNAGPTRVHQAGREVPDIEETREFIEQVQEQTHHFRRRLPLLEPRRGS